MVIRLALLATLLSICSSYVHKDYYYDFVVVGSGTAGCVVAARLAENPDWKILLIEAGGEELLSYDLPGTDIYRIVDEINWQYNAQPSDSYCISRENGRCPIPRGKVLGGSSTVNSMMYYRGVPDDYDEWAENGNEGWAWDDVLEYFKRFEDNGDPEIAADTKYHSTGGPQHVARYDYEDPNVPYLISGFNELGVPTVDVNTGEHIGVMFTQFFQRNNTRLSSYRAYVEPVRDVDNLHVVTNAYVTKILIDNDNYAYGVKYISKYGKEHIIKIKKEVIVSGGAIESPKLLMLSGIGPRCELEKYGIPVIYENEYVGKNYHDHISIVALTMIIDTSTRKSKEEIQDDVDEWYQSRTGPMGNQGPMECNSFVSLYGSEKNGRLIPDIQFNFNGKDLRISDTSTAEESRSYLPYYDEINMKCILSKPKSKGYLLLNETDYILGQPMIYLNFFSDPSDIEVLVDAIEYLTIDYLNTPSLKSIGARLAKRDFYPCNDLTGRDYWRCVLRHQTDTNYHPVGSCKMGPSYDETAVVNSKLQVYGIGNLRVIDASIMPSVTRGNTNGPTTMIGEKGAQLVKDSWDC